MSRKAILGAACWFVLSCGGAPPPAPKAEPVAAPAPPPAPPAREASPQLRRYWIHGKSPELALYADVYGLLHSEVLEALVPATLNDPAVGLRAKQKECAKVLIEAARSLAVGSDPRGTLVLLELSDEGQRAARSACVGTLFAVDRIKVEGADEAYAADDNVVVVEPGVVLLGPKPLVEAALASKGTPWPDGLALQADQQLGWKASTSRELPVAASGLVSIGHERFATSAELELPTEPMAQKAEAEISAMRQLVGAQAAMALPPEGVALVKQLVDSATLKRTGKHLSIAIELHGAPQQQAVVIGALTSMGVYGVRKYMAQAKTAEARNVIGQIAKNYLSFWNAEAVDGKLQPKGAKKKLFSLPAVPAAIPRGVKYQSAPDAWQAWQPIKFTFSDPQFYQYEVVAAKDGKSATIFARGDLDGDGVPSEFRITLRVDPKTNDLSIDPSVQESNPEE